MHKKILITGATFSFLAIAIGAFGAHGLHSILVAYDRVGTFETGVLYHIMHALAILIVGLTETKKPSNYFRYSAWIFSIGILMFSGSLYLLATLNLPFLGMITPIGGLAFLIGWATYILGLFRE
ncbi:DUF423 domain-containing protein [Marinoscillum sp. MHG1-6]|uniref:DUF423 domain-containing protein n=1 Tax=Marinoscillum sp. MHG1-6 TaxID=2959627 RepID=UPI002157C065|nr:DUF423 domain-containing protein [Marinoscillum sp. MHG1-6]